MLGDNRPANILSQEDLVTQGNQYMYLPYHFNKEVQEEGFSEVQYVKSVDNIADLLTKCCEPKEFNLLLGPLTGFDTRLVERLAKEAYGLDI